MMCVVEAFLAYKSDLLNIVLVNSFTIFRLFPAYCRMFNKYADPEALL